MMSPQKWLLNVLVLAVYRNSVSGSQSQDINVYKQGKENRTDDCTRRLTSLRFNKTEDAMQALDAFGKPGAGLLVNNREWLGHFSECENLQDFKYCLLTIDVTSSETALTMFQQRYIIKWGVCVPRECSYVDLTDGMPALLELSIQKLHDFHVNNIYEDMWCLEDPVIPYGLGFYITVTFFIIVAVLMIAGSILDVLERNSKAEDQERDQSVEDAPLLEEENDENDESLVNSLEDFNFEIEWLLKRITFNQFDLDEWENNFFFQTLILNSYYAVDSFFFLSGLLVCYTTLRRLDSADGCFPWHWFYFHRYIRLTPPMMVAIMIKLFISPYFIKGPNAQLFVSTTSCNNYWWTNLIYINNFYPWKFFQTCLPWTWYLANDMQFFVISPIIILSFKSFYWRGIAIVGTTLVISFVITGTLVAVFNFRSPEWELMMNDTEYVNVIYTKPYARIPPYLVGMTLGYLLFKLKDRKVTLPRLWFFAGWSIASAVAAAVLCGTITLHPSTDNTNHLSNISTSRNKGFIADHHASAVGSVVYEMFGRFSWGVFLSWVVISCQFGGKGWVNDILSWSFWEPLSRLNYNAYLLQLLLLYVFCGNFGLSVYCSRVLMTFYFSGTVLLSYISAMVLTLSVEIPISNLERRLMTYCV